MGYKRLIGIGEFYKDVNKIPPVIKLLSTTFLIYGISWGIIDPYFAIYLKQNLLTYSLVGLVYLIMPLTILFLSAPIGRFADVVGKKKLAVIALLFYLLLGPLYMYSRSTIQFIGSRIYHGIVYTFLWIPLLGLVRDFSGRQKVFAIGTFLSSYNVGTVIGASMLAPLITTFFPLRYIFIPLIFTNFICFLLLFKIPEGIKIKEKLKLEDLYITQINDFFKHKLSKPIAFSMFSLKFSVVMIFMILFLFLKEMGASYVQLALFYAIASIPWVLQAYFADLAEKIGKKLVLVLGFFISFVSLLLIFLTTNLALLFVFGIIASIGVTMSSPIIGGFVTKIGLGKEGEFTGVLEMISVIGTIFGSMFGGFLSDILYLNFPFLIAAVLCLISMLLFKKITIE